MVICGDVDDNKRSKYQLSEFIFSFPIYLIALPNIIYWCNWPWLGWLKDASDGATSRKLSYLKSQMSETTAVTSLNPPRFSILHQE